MKRTALLALPIAVLATNTANAQSSCVPSSAGAPFQDVYVSEPDKRWAPLNGGTIYYNTDQVADLKGSNATEKLKKRLAEAQAKWTTACTGGVPMSSGPAGSAPAGAEVWTIRRGTYTELLDAETAADYDTRRVCGKAFRDDRVIHLYDHSRCNSGEAARAGLLAHELGHPMRLGDVLGDASCTSIMKSPIDMDSASSRVVDSTNDCNAINREKVRPTLPPSWTCSNHGGSADDSWSGILPAGEHTITVWPFGGGKAGDYTLSVAIREKLIPTGSWTLPFTVSEQDVSGEQEYSFSLSSDTQVDLVVSNQSTDIDCRINKTPCPNHGGTAAETWSGTLKSGKHTVTVWPFHGSGSYTLAVTAPGTTPTTPTTPTPAPPSALACPSITDLRLPSGGAVSTVLSEATGGTAPYTYSLSGQPPGISFAQATRTASGTLPIVTADTDYTATYSCTDRAGAAASVTFLFTVLAPSSPAAPELSGSVVGRTQTLTWTEPAGRGITRYQLQTRASSAHTWRFTDAGAPSPSSSISPEARSWSVLTPWTLYRQYRLRASNASGDGAWSNVVELRTPGSPPPPLSLPGIPDFPGLPSGGVVNTLFPAATGGAAPYSYSLSGLPPGLSFTPSTRVASGTLPTVRIATTYRITYAVTDRAGGSARVTFRATIVPP